MKLIAVLISCLALLVSAAVTVEYQQASRLIPHLAPRVTASQSSVEALTSHLAPSVTASQSSVEALVSHPAPGVTASQPSVKALVTRQDNDLKNFTHNELFALQKKFLDNFVAPNNTIQVRSSTSNLRVIDL